MNRLTISPNEAVYYQYDPDNDALEVRFVSGSGPTREEPLAEMPLVSLLRDPENGQVLGVRVSSVQQFLLQKLVQELATLAQSYVGVALPVQVPEAQPAATPGQSRRSRSRKKAEAPIAEEPPAEGVVEAVGEAPIAAIEAEVPAPSPELVEAVEAALEAVQPALAEEAPTPARRSRSRKKESEPEVVVAEAPAEEPVPAKRSRSRRKKGEPEADLVEAPAEAAIVPAEAEVVLPLAEGEEAPTKPKRSRSRKKSEPESLPPTTEVELRAPEPLVQGEGEGIPVVEEEPGKSKRRRNRKKKKSGEKEEVAAVAPTLPEPLTEEAEAVDEPVTEDKATKRKRRRKRKRGKGTGEGDLSTPTPQPQPVTAKESGRAQPAAQSQPARESGRAQPATQSQPAREKRESEVPRSSYKTAPIPGLETPEAFSFMNMNPLLGQAIAAMGFEEPTPIQRRAVPIGMTGRDIIGLAQTGTGKTMAFLIPAVHRLLQTEQKGHRPRLLVLVPTRELAVQVAEEAEFLSTHTELHITTIYGGVSIDAQTKDLKRGTDIIVATPGRLLDHLNRKNVQLDTVEVLVLDEADRMLDMGFLPEIRTIVRRLPTERHTMLFSATMPPAIQSLSLDFQRDPEVIEVARQLPPASIEQVLYPVERHLKTPLLIHLLKQEEQAMRSVLIFTETKIEADVLARKLREAGVKVGLMHGDRSQREREEALYSLRTGTVRALVATDVAARGLDINDISHVVNYDIPQTVDSYVHRIGRTARGEAEGKAYTFVSSGDEGMVKRIESALERQLPRQEAEGFDYDVPTPSWAKPSSEEIIESLHQPKGLADRFRRMMRRG